MEHVPLEETGVLGEKIIDSEATPEDAVKAVLTRRIDGVKYKNVDSIINLVDAEKYTKFDDWPPFTRQNLDALERETKALKVLREYDYKATDWNVHIFGDAALASFEINYHAR